MSEEINITEILMGCQGSGKSWHGMHRAAQLADEYDAPLVIHDSGTASIRNKENPYYQADWKLHTTPFPGTFNGVRRPFDLGRNPIHVVNTAHAEDAIKYCEQLQKRGNGILLIDEVSSAVKIKPSHIGEPWCSLIAQRRARRIGLVICMQTPTMASRFLVSTATSIKCFRIEHKKNLNALIDIGYNEQQIRQIEKLPRGRYIERRQGFPSKKP